jgi:hypothetical protein
MRCWIDAQGYCNSEAKFIPKEVAVVTPYDVTKFVVSYSKQLRNFSPFDRKLVLWATKNYHRIPYFVGDTPESKLKDRILQKIGPCAEIYTKGCDKIYWLERLLQKPVHDLHLLGCPSLRKLQLGSACSVHLTSDSHCAVSGALFMSTWFNGSAAGHGRASSLEQENREQTLPGSLPSGQTARQVD